MASVMGVLMARKLFGEEQEKGVPADDDYGYIGRIGGKDDDDKDTSDKDDNGGNDVKGPDTPVISTPLDARDLGPIVMHKD